MKKNIIISILIMATVAFITGCSNKESKAQKLLIEAISYSEGTPAEAGRIAALKLAEAKGTKPGAGLSGLSEREVVMVAGRELCKQILAEYPETQAALKAAELRNQINQRLEAMSNARIGSMYDSSN